MGISLITLTRLPTRMMFFRDETQSALDKSNRSQTIAKIASVTVACEPVSKITILSMDSSSSSSSSAQAQGNRRLSYGQYYTKLNLCEKFYFTKTHGTSASHYLPAETVINYDPGLEELIKMQAFAGEYAEDGEYDDYGFLINENVLEGMQVKIELGTMPCFDRSCKRKPNWPRTIGERVVLLGKLNKFGGNTRKATVLRWEGSTPTPLIEAKNPKSPRTCTVFGRLIPVS